MRALLLVCLLLAPALPARAALLLTFEGAVFTMVDVGGVAAAAGIGPTSTVQYTVLVDFAGDSLIDTDGTLEIQPDEVGPNYLFDHFYAEYVSGDHLASGSVGFQLAPDQTNYVGENQTEVATGLETGSLYTGNLLTFGADTFVQDWQVGTVVYTRDHWKIGTEVGHVASWTTLTSIVPVPEPGTASLLALGLLALARRPRRPR